MKKKILIVKKPQPSNFGGGKVKWHKGHGTVWLLLKDKQNDHMTQHLHCSHIYQWNKNVISYKNSYNMNGDRSTIQITKRKKPLKCPSIDERNKLCGLSIHTMDYHFSHETQSWYKLKNGWKHYLLLCERSWMKNAILYN